MPPRQIDGSIPRDLETIVLKAGARHPSHRHQSAAALAEDLQRFVEDRPIQARRITQTERLWRWCRRNPVVAALVLTLIFTLAAGTVFSLSFALKWRSAAEAAELEEKNALKQKSVSDELRDLAEERERLSLRHLYCARQVQARREWEDGNVKEVRNLLDGLVPRPGAEDLRGFDYWYLQRLCRPARTILTGQASTLTALATSPDGLLMATGNMDGSVRLWQIADGSEVKTLAGPTPIPDELKPTLPPMGEHLAVEALAISPDGKTLTAAHRGFDDEKQLATHIERWDLKTGVMKRIMTRRFNNALIAWSPNSTPPGTGGQLVMTQNGRWLVYTNVSPPHLRLVVCDLTNGQDRVIEIEKKELEKFKVVREPGSHDPMPNAPGDLAVTEDGSTAAVRLDGSVTLVDLTLGTKRAERAVFHESSGFNDTLASRVARNVVTTPNGPQNQGETASPVAMQFRSVQCRRIALNSAGNRRFYTKWRHP